MRINQINKFQYIEQLDKFEVYIAFARKIGGAAGLNRIVKARWQIDWYGW